MNFSITHEVYILLYSVGAGVMISILFDFFKVIRKKAQTQTLLTTIQDVVFWILVAAIMFFLVYSTNNGRLRWYHIFGAFSGSLLYFLTISRYVLFLIGRFIDIFFKIFEVFFKILLTPLKFAYNIISVCLFFVVTPVLRVFKRIGKRFQFAFLRSLKLCKRTVLKK